MNARPIRRTRIFWLQACSRYSLTVRGKDLPVTKEQLASTSPFKFSDGILFPGFDDIGLAHLASLIVETEQALLREYRRILGYDAFSDFQWILFSKQSIERVHPHLVEPGWHDLWAVALGRLLAQGLLQRRGHKYEVTLAFIARCLETEITEPSVENAQAAA